MRSASKVFVGGKLQAGDTPMPVLAPGDGKTKTGRLWDYVRDDRPIGEQAAPAVSLCHEEEIRGKPADVRLSIREARARPFLGELRKWMEKARRHCDRCQPKARLLARFVTHTHSGVLSHTTPKMRLPRKPHQVITPLALPPRMNEA